jgi:sporulation protein YtfJ
MSESNLSGLIDTAIEKIKEMIDGNTVLGDEITTEDGTVIIPVSKISMGFAAGGGDTPTKNQKASSDGFGGGCGAGIVVTPQAFLVVSGDNVKLLQLASPSNTAERIVNLVPDVIDKVSEMFSKKDDE